MSGRPNDKWLKTMIKKYGSREAVTEKQRAIGKIGGSISRTGGFASHVVGKDGLTGTQRAKIAGRKGGIISRRGKAKNND